MHIAIVDYVGSPYDGSTPSAQGLGGSESAVVYIARELVRLGVSVDVYCDTACSEPVYFDGVKYSNINSKLDRALVYDVLISSRSCKPFTTDVNIVGKKNVLWLHDTFCDGDDVLERLVTLGKIDEVWTLSDWHATYITTADHHHKRMPEVLKRKVWMTRNGCNLYNDYVSIDKKDRDHFVWNAACNKGLHVLLESIWPRVKQKIPSAKLTVIGGYYNLRDKNDVQYLEWMNLKSSHSNVNDVTFTGVISQSEVADIIVGAGFMIYPQTLPETFGISTLESLANGTPVITGRFGALEEVAIEDACYLMNYPISSPLYNLNTETHIQHFVNMVVIAHGDEYLWRQKANKALSVRDVCGWDGIALQWKQHLYRMTDQFLSRDEYKKVMRISSNYKRVFNRRWSNPEENSPWFDESDSVSYIHVIVPFRNAEKYIDRCVRSILSQDYRNYQLTLIDDDSTDNTVQVVERLLEEFDYEHQIEFIKNDKSIGALANQMQILKSKIILDSDIVVLIDGDDELVNDPSIFKRVNHWHKTADFTYGSMESAADGIQLIAQEYPPDVIKNKTFKDHKFAWNVPYTHLRTFKGSLLDVIDVSTLTDERGEYYRAGGDVALFYALLDVVQSDRIMAVRDVVYRYNDLNPQNDYKINSEEQTMTVSKVMSKNKKILIAIPTAQNIHPQTFKSIYDLEIPDGYEADFQYFYGYCIDQVRNLIADHVIKGYDYLFAVDYDMSFKPDTLKKLMQALVVSSIDLENNVGIATGVYRQRKSEQVLELYQYENGSHVNIDYDDLQEVSLIYACGLGCALIDKGVFIDVPYPQFTYHHAIKAEDSMSEDIDFCLKTIDTGWHIIAVRDVVCSHHGQTTFEVNAT